MEKLATNVLWIVSLIFPALLFLIANKFKRLSITFIRALIAIGLGWLVQLSYSLAAQHMSGQEINGAALSFVSIFGWVIPVFIVLLCWLIHWLFISKRDKN